MRVGQVVPGAPAEAAGLKADDAILRIGGKPVRSFDDIPGLIAASVGKPLDLEVWRAGRVLHVPVTPRDDGSGPRIGIDSKYVLKKFGFVSAVEESGRWTWSMTKPTFETLERLVTARLSPKTMMGPLGIAKASGDAARGGWGRSSSWWRSISLQVGILNLFPLPPLDGGHLAILLGESVVRRDFSAA